MAIEKPTYTLIKKDGRFEIRRYEPYLTAQVTVKANDYRQAANIGFSPLANFIFGSNTSKQKIPMTAPVSAQPQSEMIKMTAPVSVSGNEEYIVSFVIPKKYTLDTLPIPNDRRVVFKENPQQTFAVKNYSGSFSQTNFERHLCKLKKWMQEHALKVAGEPVFAGYNPPFTPAFLRHNEILIPVE